MSESQEKTIKRFEAKIEQLETKISFQELTIDELNDALTMQQKDIDKLTTQVGFLLNKLKAMEPANIANANEESPPPHY